MPKMLKRTLLIIVSLLLLIIVGGAIYGTVSVRRSFPQTDGEITLPGLHAPVEVYRDSYGVPHIYASNAHDLFMAQGYVQAQDRFWQMDFWRHIGSGRLSEMFGESSVETDAFLRTLGWARIVEQELTMFDSDTTAALEAYADGVNVYMSEFSGSELSFEYTILAFLNPDYEPEPWEPLHTVTWVKAMAWDLGGNMGTEIQRSILAKTLSAEQIDELFPPYDGAHPYIVPNPHLTGGSAAAEPGAGALAFASTPALNALSDQVAGLDFLLGGWDEGIGSNNWVISGDLTDTGMPLLANDPHLGPQMPSIWYEVGLHCMPKSAQCPYDVTGFGFSSAPGLVIGHNDRIAWGFTNVGPDVMDLYIEKINPANPNQYEYNGEWVDMDIVNETIFVGGGDPVELAVRYTLHGPIISETYGGLEEYTETAGIDLPENYAIALRWTALEPGFTYQSLLKLNRAESFEDFRNALREFSAPSQSMVFADVDGNIGYQTPGHIPIRQQGHSGLLPVPGWTDAYEWEALIPFDDLPFIFNPPEGYIATANNALIPPEYPYMISMQWAYGYRAQTIVDMIEQAPGPISIAYIQQMHGSNRNINAENLLPTLLQLEPVSDLEAEALEILQKWDYENHMDQAAPAIFESFWAHALAATFNDDLPERYWAGGGSRWYEVMYDISSDINNPWWDDQATSAVETRDDIFQQAFTAAIEELTATFGKNPDKWNWGDLHTITIQNQTLGASGIAPIEALFNRGPFRTSGGSGIVNATAYSTKDPYAVSWVPSMRMIVDLGNLQNSWTIHLTGQSGHAYHPHYFDMADPWRLIEYHPMHWDRPAVEADAEGHLILKP